MDIVRRNTDYALRAMVNLAKNYGEEPKSTRKIAEEEGISYQLACKLLQKLHDAKLVESMMGPRGGFSLGMEPAKINLLEIIETIQGPVRLNRCLLDEDSCLRRSGCRIHDTLAGLQDQVAQFLTGTTLANVCNGTGGDANPGKSGNRSDK